MSNRIGVMLVKEWADFASRRWLVVTTLVVPLMFLVVFPFGIGIGLTAILGERAYNDPDLEKIYQAIRSSIPALADASPKDLFQVFLHRQFIVLSLLIPVMSTMTIATYSIVGEKVNRSLEPLLATPITTTELLLGKALAATIPAMAVTWAFFAIFAGGIRFMSNQQVYNAVVNPTALLIVVLVAPLIAVFALSLAIIASSRSADPRSAQQIAVIVVLPLVAVIIGQVSGIFLLTPGLVVAAAAGLLAVDIVVLGVGVRLFERETILTRWK
jgi:ABC-2 type transport system permease protein